MVVCLDVRLILRTPAGRVRRFVRAGTGVVVALAFYRVTQWVAPLGEAKRQGQLETELRPSSFLPLIVVDEVGADPARRAEGGQLLGWTRPGRLRIGVRRRLAF